MNKQLPNLRTNIATWAVPIEHVPAVTEAMLDNLPPEDYDPTFQAHLRCPRGQAPFSATAAE